MNTYQSNQLTQDEVAGLLVTLVKPLVSHPTAVAVAIRPNDRFTEYALTVAPDDIGEVIGRHGQVAQAIRTVLYGVRTTDQKRNRLLIVDENKKGPES
ncbi:KH domain-containing protein [Furfurilactobacillus sp. WILCCON 0119]|uniref:KH domain-containing protein n=1 Tax=Furfurilactobacillus entadae TaxID=2922307 RepID=UPI0035E71100